MKILPVSKKLTIKARKEMYEQMQYKYYKHNKASSSGNVLEAAINAVLDAFENAIYRLVCKFVKPKRKRK